MPSRLRTLWFTFLISVIGLLGTMLLLEFDKSISTKQHVTSSSNAIAQGASILLAPLTANEDRVSINYILNEITQHPYIKGMRITDTQESVLGLSGNQQGALSSINLSRNDEFLGKLDIWSDETELLTLLDRQRSVMALGAGITLLVVLIFLLVFLRPRTISQDSTKKAHDNNEDNSNLKKSKVRIDDDSLPNIASSAITKPAHTPVKPIITETQEQEADTSIEIEHTEDESNQPKLIAQRDSTADLQFAPINLSAAEVNLNDYELVSLLRPERDNHQIPKFNPSATNNKTDERDLDKFDHTPLIELEELDSNPEPDPLNKQISNSLLSALDDNTIPTHLFTFEQELEMALPAAEASYLLLITPSKDESFIDEDEYQNLLDTYNNLAKSVSTTYSGRIDNTDKTSIKIFFDRPKEDDSHGVNAVCAAMLFICICEKYNHARSNLFQPTLKFHSSLVRGNSRNLDLLVNEAKFLIASSQPDELISHTPLTESVPLKDTLLKDAQIRREGEDRVTLLQISQSYHELFEKQSKHILNQLAI